jgi:hypothetical protein
LCIDIAIHDQDHYDTVATNLNATDDREEIADQACKRQQTAEASENKRTPSKQRKREGFH